MFSQTKYKYRSKAKQDNNGYVVRTMYSYFSHAWFKLMFSAFEMNNMKFKVGSFQKHSLNNFYTFLRIHKVNPRVHVISLGMKNWKSYLIVVLISSWLESYDYWRGWLSKL